MSETESLQVALVTGAGRGLGPATACAFKGAGYTSRASTSPRLKSGATDLRCRVSDPGAVQRG